MSLIDNRIIKASFRENPVEERRTFPKSSCLMPISVGQAIHEGEKFAAVIKLINTSFKQCTILVDDSVQRHTLAISRDATADELYHEAVAAGDAWLARHKAIYQELTIPFTIMRWDDWFHCPAYAASYQRVKHYYDRHASYRQAIDANIETFLTRYLKHQPSHAVTDERNIRLCRDYLLEECAVMCLWTAHAYDFEVYPSGRNDAMAATYDHLIKPDYPHYLRPVALRFKKYPGTQKMSQCPTITHVDHLLFGQ